MVYAFDLKSNFIYINCLVIWRVAGVWFIGIVLKTGGCNSPLGSNPSPSAIKGLYCKWLHSRGDQPIKLGGKIGWNILKLKKNFLIVLKPIGFSVITESNGALKTGSTCRYSPQALIMRKTLVGRVRDCKSLVSEFDSHLLLHMPR